MRIRGYVLKNIMENNKFKKGISEIKNIVMTDDDKKRIFENILKISNSNQKPIRSPWMTFSFLAILEKNKFAYYMIIPLIIILSSGGIALASNDSLPDSFLYPFKVRVVEPIRGTLSFSQGAKAKYKVNLATERMIEAETLANQGKLDEPKKRQLKNLLEEHTTDLNNALNKVNKSNKNKDVEEIVNNFDVEMNEHAENLDNIIKNKKIESDNVDKEENKDKDKDKNKKKNEDTTDSIKSEENQNKNESEDIEVSDNARLNANKIRDNFKKEDISPETHQEDKEENENDR